MVDVDPGPRAGAPVLVTGATGFVGARRVRAVERLAAALSARPR